MASFRTVLNKVIGPLFLMALGIGGCSIWWSKQADEVRQKQASYDASAVIACRDFRSALKDTLDGILTNAELRQRIQKVHDNARLADSKVAPGVADGARLLLAATTSGPRDERARAIDLMRQACSQPGTNRP